jgi:hypothetical protein
MYGAGGQEDISSAWDSFGAMLRTPRTRLILFQPMRTVGLPDAGRIRIRRKEFKLEHAEP